MEHPVLAGRDRLRRFVVALLLVQSAIFIYWVDRPGEGNPRHAQLRRVIAAAAELGDAFERGGPVDVAAIVGSQPDLGGPLYVVLADGTAVAAGGGPVPEGVRQTALLMLRGDAPGAGQPLTGGPATYAPIQAGGVLKGFVIAAPPP